MGTTLNVHTSHTTNTDSVLQSTTTLDLYVVETCILKTQTFIFKSLDTIEKNEKVQQSDYDVYNCLTKVKDLTK